MRHPSTYEVGKALLFERRADGTIVRTETAADRLAR